MGGSKAQASRHNAWNTYGDSGSRTKAMRSRSIDGPRMARIEMSIWDNDSGGGQEAVHQKKTRGRS